MKSLKQKLVGGGGLLMGLALLTLTLISTMSVQAETAQQTQGDVAAGRAVFMRLCMGCHVNGGLQAGRGPKLEGTTRDDEYIRNNIRNGRGIMPAYAPDRISDPDIVNVIAYIRALPGSAQQVTTAASGATTAAATTARATTAAGATTAAATTTRASVIPQGGAPATGTGGATAGESFNPAWLLLPLVLAFGLSGLALLTRTGRARH